MNSPSTFRETSHCDRPFVHYLLTNDLMLSSYRRAWLSYERACTEPQERTAWSPEPLSRIDAAAWDAEGWLHSSRWTTLRPANPPLPQTRRVTEFLSQRFGDLAKVSCLSQNRPEDRSADF